MSNNVLPKRCGQVLNCGHRCKGNLQSCRQGRLHVHCEQRCSQRLVCGHFCMEKCCRICPPCTLTHSFDSVSECCFKNGEHASSTSCRALEQCLLTIPCGHRCLGLKVEKCLRLCRTCRPSDIAFDIFLGGEDCADAVFYQLNDCGHTFEVQSLDEYMDKASFTVSLKGCPKCFKPIVTSNRYADLVKQPAVFINQLKRKMNSINFSALNDERLHVMRDFHKLIALEDCTGFSAEYAHCICFVHLLDRRQNLLSIGCKNATGVQPIPAIQNLCYDFACFLLSTTAGQISLEKLITLQNLLIWIRHMLLINSKLCLKSSETRNVRRRSLVSFMKAHSPEIKRQICADWLSRCYPVEENNNCHPRPALSLSHQHSDDHVTVNGTVDVGVANSENKFEFDPTKTLSEKLLGELSSLAHFLRLAMLRGLAQQRLVTETEGEMRRVHLLGCLFEKLLNPETIFQDALDGETFLSVLTYFYLSKPLTTEILTETVRPALLDLGISEATLATCSSYPDLRTAIGFSEGNWYWCRKEGHMFAIGDDAVEDMLNNQPACSKCAIKGSI